MLERFNYFMVTALLSTTGFKFEQEVYSELEIWQNPRTGKKFRISKRQEYLSEESLLSVLKQAGLSSEEFFKLT